MPQGVVKTYDPVTGYGIVVPDEGDDEIYLRPGSLTGSIFRMVRQGQRIVYDLTTEDGRQYAGNLRVGQDGY
ncbi:MAG TPA: cold shock domain-containing protein [Acidimicrobiia bacterium]|nr:cold shock domain-containing protein [Acidimicrobiia bacterium]